MRWVKVSQEELAKIKDLYEGVMSHACHGLFFREGAVLGADFADEGLHDRNRYFPTVADMLKTRGWVEDIQFSDQAITARGSVEVVQSDIPTCHRLRGIIREVYERYRGTRVNCTEEECASLGKDHCKFTIEEI